MMNGSQHQKSSNNLRSCYCKCCYWRFGKTYQLVWLAMHNLKATVLCLSYYSCILDIKPLYHLSVYHEFWGYAKAILENTCRSNRNHANDQSFNSADRVTVQGINQKSNNKIHPMEQRLYSCDIAQYRIRLRNVITRVMQISRFEVKWSSLVKLRVVTVVKRLVGSTWSKGGDMKQFLFPSKVRRSKFLDPVKKIVLFVHDSM